MIQRRFFLIFTLFFILAGPLALAAEDSVYRDPSDILGFHIHMDVEPEVHPHALSCRQALLEFMEAENIPVSDTGAYKPGSGPHCRHSWEICVEPEVSDSVLEYLGSIARWVMHHQHLPGMWIHPVTAKLGPEDLESEMEDHLQRLVFGEEPVLDLDFFRNPP